MQTDRSHYQKYVFVCENERSGQACCMPEGAQLREALKDAVKAEGLSQKVRVSRSGCLDLCAQGPSILLMPDNKWYKKVAIADIPTLIASIRKSLT